MSRILTTTIKAPLASYVDVATFRSNVESIYGQDSLDLIAEAKLAADLISITPNYTEDATDYIGTITSEWNDQSTLDTYLAREEIVDEHALLDSTFTVSREQSDG